MHKLAASDNQLSADVTPLEAPAEPDAIPLETGGVEGQTAQETWYEQWGNSFVRNVSRATLTPFLPDKPKANGAAVIVAPGGAFRILSMEDEGWEVAEALKARGVAAFVLNTGWCRPHRTGRNSIAATRSLRPHLGPPPERPRACR